MNMMTRMLVIACLALPFAACKKEEAPKAVEAAPLTRAYVNNGGDIALHLAEGETFRIGLVERPDRPNLFATASIAAADPVRGIATSGYPGRSFSLGIALALHRVDVKALDPYAFPIMALSYVGVVLACRFILNEHISPRRWIGIATIVVGVVLVTGQQLG